MIISWQLFLVENILQVLWQQSYFPHQMVLLIPILYLIRDNHWRFDSPDLPFKFPHVLVDAGMLAVLPIYCETILYPRQMFGDAWH